MAGKYDSSANGDESVRLLAARLAQSSLTSETATLHVLPSTTSPGEPFELLQCSHERFHGPRGPTGVACLSGGGGAPPRAQ